MDITETDNRMKEEKYIYFNDIDFEKFEKISKDIHLITKSKILEDAVIGVHINTGCNPIKSVLKDYEKKLNSLTYIEIKDPKDIYTENKEKFELKYEEFKEGSDFLPKKSLYINKTGLYKNKLDYVHIPKIEFTNKINPIDFFEDENEIETDELEDLEIKNSIVHIKNIEVEKETTEESLPIATDFQNKILLLKENKENTIKYDIYETLYDKLIQDEEDLNKEAFNNSIDEDESDKLLTYSEISEDDNLIESENFRYPVFDVKVFNNAAYDLFTTVRGNVDSIPYVKYPFEINSEISEYMIENNLYNNQSANFSNTVIPSDFIYLKNNKFNSIKLLNVPEDPLIIEQIESIGNAEKMVEYLNDLLAKESHLNPILFAKQKFINHRQMEFTNNLLEQKHFINKSLENLLIDFS
ncbi:MAG: hypothetical protein CMF42_01415 [Legionellales bacterium]|nr:hypothetical protein [Legionellales bacterium]